KSLLIGVWWSSRRSAPIGRSPSISMSLLVISEWSRRSPSIQKPARSSARKSGSSTPVDGMKQFVIWTMSVAFISLASGQAMSQQNCDVVKVANDYVKTHFPFIDTNPDRRVVALSIGAYSQVTFHLPDRYLGFVPEITV